MNSIKHQQGMYDIFLETAKNAIQQSKAIFFTTFDKQT